MPSLNVVPSNVFRIDSDLRVAKSINRFKTKNQSPVKVNEPARQVENGFRLFNRS